MPKWNAVFFFLILALCSPSVSAREKGAPKNADKGEILLAGLVLAPGRGGTQAGLPEGIVPLAGALVTIEGTKYVTTTDSRGLFIFVEAPEGDVTLVIACKGYKTERRKARVEKGVEEAPTLRVEMLPEGSSIVGDVLSGTGTLYACFVPRTESSTGDDGDFTNLLAVLALGVDPQSLGESRETPPVDPEAMNWAPTTDSTRAIMARPDEAPSRTTFHQMDSLPIWPCFSKDGKVLYVSTVYPHRIEVIGVTRGNESLAWIPLEGGSAFVTSLTLSRDGRHLFATQFGKRSGVLVVDTATHLASAFLTVDDSAGMIPNALTLSPDGSRIYVTLSNGLNVGAPGRLATLDPVSGATLGSVEVGATPTDVLITPDGGTAVTVNLGQGHLSVVDLAQGKVIRTIASEVSPTKAVLSGDHLLVANRGSNTVTVSSLIDGRLLGRIKVGRGPMDIVLTPDGGTAYVSNYLDGTISVIDLPSMVVRETTPPMPRSNPMGLAIRP